MAIKMHTAGKKPDWENIKEIKWNIWQKLAASTGGIVTPANLISLIGAGLVIVGFLQFDEGVTLPGIILIILGRLADVVDGLVAHLTGTKSPLGEIIDTTIDKLTVFFGLGLLIIFNLLPAIFAAAIILQSSLNSGASLVGRSRKIQIHPSQYGKLATFLAWVTIISYLLHKYLQSLGDARLLSGTAFALAYISFVFFVLLAVHSTASYLNQLRKTGRHKFSK